MQIRKLAISHWPLTIIFLLAAILRFWNLGSNPPSLDADEAALGYNAFSIIKTGRDEYGKFLPVIFKSFGDYKPGLYVYLTVPPVAVFGLTEFATRFPSALAGIFSVFLIYLIVSKLFANNKLLAICAAFLAAINPWFLYLSRGAWEANIALTLTLAGIYFFLKFLEKPKFLILSSIFFSLTLLAYQGAKLATGIVVIILLLLYWREIFSASKKILGASVLIGIVIAIPIFISLFRGETGRLNVFSIFSYPRTTESLTAFLSEGNEKIGSLSYYIFHSETLNFKRAILGRWFNHFSGRFLFFEGDWSNPRQSAPYVGVFIFADLILLIAGFIGLVRMGVKKEVLFVFLWMVLAPLPAALSRNEVHSVRAFALAVPLIIMSAVGLTQLFKWKKWLLGLFVFIYLINYSYFLEEYFVHQLKHNSQYWDYGYKQIVQTVTSIQSQYKTIKVQQSFAQPYIYFLFFQRYDPAKYQKTAELVPSENVADVGYHTKLDNIQFTAIDWPINKKEHGTLVVADPIIIPSEDANNSNFVKPIKEIRYLDGTVAFRIVEVK
ncbi:glycosyltransferase family 39 protein [Patescibacteria group bacterium]|nr:glycosyltransferase family 39 protein [Patescibacteria group bacterium]